MGWIRRPDHTSTTDIEKRFMVALYELHFQELERQLALLCCWLNKPILSAVGEPWEGWLGSQRGERDNQEESGRDGGVHTTHRHTSQLVWPQEAPEIIAPSHWAARGARPQHAGPKPKESRSVGVFK